MYISTNTNQYPITEQDIRKAFPNTSFPVIFQPPEGYEFVFPKPKPEHDSVVEYVVEVTPILTNNNIWEQQWQVLRLYDNQSDEDAAVLTAQISINNLLKSEIIRQTQQRLDQFAQTRGYDSILSACTYATSPSNKFAAEGQYCVNLRDATWSKLLEILSEAESGTRPVPQNYEEIEPELPQLVWPS